MGDLPRVYGPRPVTSPVRPPLVVPADGERPRRQPGGSETPEHAAHTDTVELHDGPATGDSSPAPAVDLDGHVDIAV